MKRTRYLVWAPNALVFLACLVIGGCISLHLGQDANFDLTNYHLYNAWAFLHQRWKTDLSVVGIQEYFNPLIELPYYALAVSWLPDHPRVVAFLMGLPCGLLIYLTMLVIWMALGDYVTKPLPRGAYAVLAVIFGFMGTVIVSQVGTTFNEIQTATLVVAGIAVLIYGFRHRDRRNPGAAILSGGLLLGLAAGLKFTACLYAAPAALGIFAVSASWRHKFLNPALFSISWIAAFVLSYAWWGWHVYAATGNPMYPMFGGMFHTSYTPPIDMVRLYNAFKPQTVTQALFYPFFWLTRQTSGVGLGFADPRFAVAMIATLVWVPLYVWRRYRARRPGVPVGANEAPAPRAVFVMVFIIFSYVEWLLVFSYLRYAVPIAALLGITVAFATLELVRTSQAATGILITTVTMVAVTSFAAFDTIYPNWGRVEYGQRVWDVQRIQLPPNSLVLLFGGPVQYLAPAIAAENTGAEFVGDPGNVFADMRYGLGRALFQKVSEYSGPIYVLKRTDMETFSTKSDSQQEMDDVLKDWTVSVSSSLCLPFSSNVDWDLEICSAHNAKSDMWAPAPGSPLPGSPAAPQVPASDQHALTFTVNWTAADLGGATGAEHEYRLFMAKGGGDYTQVFAGPSTSAPVTVDYDGHYSFKVKACVLDVCSGFSGVSGDYETYIRPSEPREVTVSSRSTPMDLPAVYTVSWRAPAVRGAVVTYLLQEEVGQGGFATIYSGMDTSHEISHDRSGIYSYRVIACDSFDSAVCGQPTAEHAVQVGSPATRK